MRVALSTFGTLGDIIPFARLASALVARGHAVTYHTWEQFRGWVPDGVAFAPAAGGIDARESEAYMLAALRASAGGAILEQVRAFAHMFYGDVARSRAYYTRARELFAGHDVVVTTGLDQFGQLAADELEITWLCYRSHPLGDAAFADRFFADLDAELAALVKGATGLSRRVRLFRDESPIATLVACSPHLADQPRASRTLLTGAWLEPAPRAATPAARIDVPALPGELATFLDGGPALLVTFGVMPDVTGRTAALVAAAARTGWRAIVQVLPPAEPPAHVPDGILIVRDRLPFAALFPRVAAVVHHASVGTLHEVVRAARPSLTVPHMGDQFFWGGQLAACGLGPPPIAYNALDPDVLAERFAALRDPAFAARAAALAPMIAAEDGVAFAVRHVEAAPDGGPP